MKPEPQKPEPVTPQISAPVSVEDVRLPSGLFVRRTHYSNGNIADRIIWPGDAKNVRIIRA